MNYEKLVKALRYCMAKEDGITICEPCSYYGKGIECENVLHTDAATAIEVLQAEQKKTVTHIFCEEQSAEESEELIEKLKKIPVGPIEPIKIEPIEPHWVSVEDSMPDLLQFVLVCNDEGKCVVAQYVGYQTDGTTPWRIAYSMYDTDAYLEADEGPVCYWMPIPETMQK